MHKEDTGISAKNQRRLDAGFIAAMAILGVVIIGLSVLALLAAGFAAGAGFLLTGVGLMIALPSRKQSGTVVWAITLLAGVLGLLLVLGALPGGIFYEG